MCKLGDKCYDDGKNRVRWVYGVGVNSFVQCQDGVLGKVFMMKDKIELVK